MIVQINQSVAKGVITAPPSKSYAHRLLISAALSNQTSKVNNVLISKDIEATINCLKTLGKEIKIINNSSFYKTVIVKTKKTFDQLDDLLIFNCNESGSTLRFFIPIALLTGKKLLFKGTPKLISRGISPYESICQKQNIKIIKNNDSILFEGQIKPDNFIIPGNISSQFITGLLFALPLLKEDSKITITNHLESKNYIDITQDVLSKAQIKIINNESQYFIKGNQQYHLLESTVEADYSNASVLEAFNYVNGNVIIKGLNQNSFQGDKIYQEYFKLLKEDYQELDIGNCIDLGPILFAFASIHHGAKFINTNRLKIKESDRIKDVAIELLKFGIKIEEYENYVIINKDEIHHPTSILNSHNDHRIVMMLSFLSSIYKGTIEGAECISKSYPNFFNDLENLGIEVKYVR